MEDGKVWSSKNWFSHQNNYCCQGLLESTILEVCSPLKHLQSAEEYLMEGEAGTIQWSPAFPMAALIPQPHSGQHGRGQLSWRSSLVPGWATGQCSPKTVKCMFWSAGWRGPQRNQPRAWSLFQHLWAEETSRWYLSNKFKETGHF